MNPQDEPQSQPQVPNQADDTSVVGGTVTDNASQPPAEDSKAITEIPLPAEAEDTDLIEKEWVDRAKQIVEHTREDPYEQQRALSEMKADYLKKRYGKDIKLHSE